MKKSFSIKIFFFSLLFIFNSFAQQKTILKLDLVDKKLPFGLTKKIPLAQPKIGLALSGGGSRALSQIGVLKSFEEKNIPIEFIVGTSMGSIVGGLYSAGYKLNELDSIMKATDWEDFFSAKQSERNELFVDQKVTEDKALLTLRLNGLKPILPTSLSSGQRAANFLNLMVIATHDFEPAGEFLVPTEPGFYEFLVKLPPNLLTPGKYFLGATIAGMAGPSRYRALHRLDHSVSFDIFDNGSLLSQLDIPWKGIVHADVSWKRINEPGE